MSSVLAGDERATALQTIGHRRSDRRQCDFGAVIVSPYGEWRARIVNISAGGLGFTIDPMLDLKPGERITLREQTLGEVRCTVRWSLHPRYGAEFEPRGRTPAGVCALYDSLEPADSG